VNPEATTQQCQWHFRQRLLRAHASELEKSLFERLLSIPKGHMAAGDYLYSQIPLSSCIRQVPKDELFPVFMRPGVCPHAWKTNQAAEVSNKMLRSVRDAASIYSALVECESVLRVRNHALVTTLLEAKGISAQGVINSKRMARLDDPWPVSITSNVPAVAKAIREASFAASRFADPVFSVGGADPSSSGGNSLTVTHPPMIKGGGIYVPQTVFVVRPEQMKEGRYEDVCGCGRCATNKDGCNELQKCLEAMSGVYREVPAPTHPPNHPPTLPTHQRRTCPV
jgi:hypothetical protein